MLKSQHLGIKNVKDENIDHYIVKLQETADVKKVLVIDWIKYKNKAIFKI